MSDSFEVRDHRNKAMFRVDDEYLNGYSKLCGVNATLVYLCLCRHADRHQESFPSVLLMAEKTGISRDSVMRGIKSLISWNIISKERERKANAKWLNNRYILLDKSVWKPKPSSCEQLGSQVANGGEPSRTQNESQVAVSDTKDTHKKVTHIEGYVEASSTGEVINQFIELFKEINPTYSFLFRRKDMRASSERLMKLKSIEEWQRVIGFIVKFRANKYCPRITTPSQLEQKYSELELFANGLKEDIKNKKSQVAF